MKRDAQAPLRAQVAARYRASGRFAFHYVAAKLRTDPLTRTLLDAGHEFGEVVDVGCGRGQFAALLLEAGLARSVEGLDGDATLLEQARAAMRGLRFAGRLQDLAADASLPEADTVMIVDVLYQLPDAAQSELLHRAALSARRQVVVRTTDPSQGSRAVLTRTLEIAARRFWPHSGALVNPRPIDWVAGRLASNGLTVEVAPCWAGTPFGNVLLTARR